MYRRTGSRLSISGMGSAALEYAFGDHHIETRDPVNVMPPGPQASLKPASDITAPPLYNKRRLRAPAPDAARSSVAESPLDGQRASTPENVAEALVYGRPLGERVGNMGEVEVLTEVVPRANGQVLVVEKDCDAAL